MNTLSAYDRATILESCTKWMKEEKNLQRLLQRSCKTNTCCKGEVDRTVQTYKFAAEEAKRIYGETLPLDAAPGAMGVLHIQSESRLGL